MIIIRVDVFFSTSKQHVIGSSTNKHSNIDQLITTLNDIPEGYVQDIVIPCTKLVIKYDIQLKKKTH